MTKELTLDDFYNKYNTEYNQVLLRELNSKEDTGSTLADDIAPFGGCMYETYGEEYEYVKTITRKRVWTIMDGDSGDLIIVAGLWFVNRMGYLITDEEYTDNDENYLVD